MDRVRRLHACIQQQNATTNSPAFQRQDFQADPMDKLLFRYTCRKRHELPTGCFYWCCQEYRLLKHESSPLPVVTQQIDLSFLMKGTDDAFWHLDCEEHCFPSPPSTLSSLISCRARGNAKNRMRQR